MIFTGSRGDGYTGERQERKPHRLLLGSWPDEFWGHRLLWGQESQPWGGLQEWVQGEDRYLQGKNGPKWAVWGPHRRRVGEGAAESEEQGEEDRGARRGRHGASGMGTALTCRTSMSGPCSACHPPPLPSQNKPWATTTTGGRRGQAGRFPSPTAIRCQGAEGGVAP